MRYVTQGLLILLSLITGGLFLYSAWTKVLPIQPFEYTIVEYLHLPWLPAAILARLLIGLEATLGGLIVLHLFGEGKRVLKGAAALLVVFSVYLVWLWATAGDDVNCGCFGDDIFMSPSVSLGKNAVLLLFTLLLIRYHKGLALPNARVRNTVNTSLFFAGLALPFILFPMAMGEPDWLKKSMYKLEVAPLYHPIKDDTAALRVPYPDTPSVDLTHGRHIVAFVSPSCEHCRIAMRKMSLMKRSDPSMPFFMIIGGIASDLTDFWKYTHAQNIPYMRLHRDPFLNYTGGRFPLIIWVEDGMVIATATYNTLEQRDIKRWVNGKLK
ncbi:protein tlpB [Nemorincola caseinilytica]|uniref:Protein tlpB n=1 Tax=Nemorincola caseinilytica TaxID=2054315 RepID=A0ABP8N948_9BACT